MVIDDLQTQFKKQDGIVSSNVQAVAAALLAEAKKALPDDPIVQAISLDGAKKVSELIPLLNQVRAALPTWVGIG